MENAARQNQADAYSGIKNVEEFDKVISEITLQNDNGRLGNQSASN
ncbi:MAG: hypothetical protein IPL21_16030 [Saprospirales bacterium]|nr:hypothetical protein [Saprospirales bacterium]